MNHRWQLVQSHVNSLPPATMRQILRQIDELYANNPDGVCDVLLTMHGLTVGEFCVAYMMRLRA